MLPKVSFVTPTFNRFPAHAYLVAETVESYRRIAATYSGECEMILVNDTPGQELTCDVPGVRIINSSTRFPTLGEKRNAGVEAARGTVILVQDDDDISLAHRATLSVGRLGSAEYYNPRAYWFLCNGKLVHEQRTGYAHNCSAFLKTAWAKVGGYPATSGDEDCRMDGLLRKRCSVVEGPLEPHESFFIYRWGCSPRHLSGVKDHNAHYRQIGQERIVEGRFQVEPSWQMDYEAMCKEALAAAPRMCN